MALSCTLAGFMTWGANRQQLPFALLRSLGPAMVPSLLSQWYPGGQRDIAGLHVRAVIMGMCLVPTSIPMCCGAACDHGLKTL